MWTKKIEEAFILLREIRDSLQIIERLLKEQNDNRS